MLWGKTSRSLAWRVYEDGVATGSLVGTLSQPATAVTFGLREQLGDDPIDAGVEYEADMSTSNLVIERRIRIQAVSPVDHAVVVAVE